MWQSPQHTQGNIEFYTRIILKNNLFEPVMTVFMENGNRYNLLNSAVLELIDYIRRSNIKVGGTTKS